MKRTAGILLFRFNNAALEVLWVHQVIASRLIGVSRDFGVSSGENRDLPTLISPVRLPGRGRRCQYTARIRRLR